MENALEMLIRAELLLVAILINVFVGLASEVRDFRKQHTPPQVSIMLIWPFVVLYAYVLVELWLCQIKIDIFF